MTKRCENLTLAVCVVFVCAISMGLCACRTTISPGGEVAREVDLDTTIALTQLALTNAEEELDLYLLRIEQSPYLMVGIEAERAARTERIERLRSVLTDLFAQRAEEP